MLRSSAIWTGVLSLAVTTSIASAALLDQAYDPGPNAGGYFVNSSTPYAQIFTAGLSGPVAGVDARVFNYFGGANAPLQLDLWSISGAYPESLTTHLASASIASGLVPSTSGFVSFDLSGSGASFTASQKYAIVLSTTSNFSYLWDGSSLGTYAGGSGRQPSSGSLYYTLAGQDLDFGFKTFVAVPEVSTLSMAGLGLAAIVVGARRRREKRTTNGDHHESETKA